MGSAHLSGQHLSRVDLSWQDMPIVAEFAYLGSASILGRINLFGQDMSNYMGSKRLPGQGKLICIRLGYVYLGTVRLSGQAKRRICLSRQDKFVWQDKLLSWQAKPT